MVPHREAAYPASRFPVFPGFSQSCLTHGRAPAALPGRGGRLCAALPGLALLSPLQRCFPLFSGKEKWGGAEAVAFAPPIFLFAPLGKTPCPAQKKTAKIPFCPTDAKGLQRKIFETKPSFSPVRAKKAPGRSKTPPPKKGRVWPARAHTAPFFRGAVARGLTGAFPKKEQAGGRLPSACSGTPDRIRICDLWSRSPTLYPAELRAPMLKGSRAFPPPLRTRERKASPKSACKKTTGTGGFLLTVTSGRTSC